MKGRNKNRMPSPEIDIYDIIPRVHLDPARMTKAPPDGIPDEKSIPILAHQIDMDDALELNRIINQHK